MRRFFTQPHTLFVFLSLLFGLLLIFLQPTGAGYDEETHFARIYEMSSGHLIPNSYIDTNGIPETFYQVSYRQDKILSPITWTQFKESFNVTFDGAYNIGHRTRATYSPVNYMPQAVIMLFLGRGLNLSLPIIYYIIRFSYLLSFILMGYFAIRLIPVGKWVLFVLMLAPTTALQFSTITADSITFGVSFLFIAWSLHLVMDKVSLNRKNLWLTLLFVFLLACVKVNSLPLFLLLLFLKPDQFASRRSRLFFWISTIFILVVVAGGWNMIALNSSSVQSESVNETSGLKLVLNALKSPFTLISGLFSYIAFNFRPVMTSWMAIYGYGYWTVPGIVYLLFPCALLFAGLHDMGNKKMTLSIRLGLLGLFLLIYIGTFALRFIPSKVMGGNATIQGRYVVAMMPLLFLGLVAWGRSLPLSKWLAPLSVTFLILSLIFYLSGMGLSYYRLCGENIYNGKDCLQPVYKNWGPSKNDMVQLSSNGTIQQSVVFDCNKIDMIRIQVLNLDPSISSGEFTFSFYDPQYDKTIAEEIFSMQDIPENGYIQLDFPAVNGVVNRELIIQIQDLSTTNLNLGIPVTDPGEYRDPDSFSINGEVQDKDILFLYRCVN